jgi:hypothetical protein
MSLGKCGALLITGVLARFALTWKPAVRPVGLIYLPFQGIGPIL